MQSTLKERLLNAPYSAYSYSYPHKTAYRPLARPLPLAPLWASEKKDALFLYLHIPFCEMRCGFCNLFTLAKPNPELTQRYVEQLLIQMQAVATEIGPHHIARFALGGGTPSYLSTEQLATLIKGAQDHFHWSPTSTPMSVEVSPHTLTDDKMALLAEAGVDRVSIGIQSFFEDEVTTLIRPQPKAIVTSALERIRNSGVATLNLDLIYGIPQQTPERFRASLLQALQWQPEEIYLYPLYIRNLTGLEQIRSRSPLEPSTQAANDHRAQLYTIGREILLTAGYEQISMRMFQRPQASGKAAPVYCCQEDGMIGLGCGARSYTRSLHYSTEYAIGRHPTQEIITQYCARPASWFQSAHYGIELDTTERKRRFVIQSLLTQPGLSTREYQQRFTGSDLFTDIPLLAELMEAQLAQQNTDIIQLTEQGLALSDSIGPALISEPIRARMQEYTLS